MRVKTAPARVKTVAQADDMPEGAFSALVSVFGTVDSVGDVVMPGAFSKTLAKFAEKDAPIPVVWSHDWNDPFSHIGYTTSATETDAGLEVSGQLDLSNPKAAQVYRLLKGGRVRDFSFAYEINDWAEAEHDGKNVLELRELDVFEVGPTLVGAHRDTELLSIKSTGERVAAPTITTTTRSGTVHIYFDGKKVEPAPPVVKAGRVLSAKNEGRIEKIAALAQELLESVQNTDSSTQDEGKATPASSGTTEEPPVKVDDQSRPGTASNRLRTDLDLIEAEIVSLTD